MNGQIGFYFRQDRCSGCATCQVACKEKNRLPPGMLFRTVREFTGGGYRQSGLGVGNDVYAYWLSLACNHCTKPLCAAGCPVGAISKRPDNGVVQINAEQCTGCRRCVAVCPYGAPQFDPVVQRVSKCDFCADLLVRGEPPACVSACPMRALQQGLLAELPKQQDEAAHLPGMPRPDVTNPSLVIVPHKQARSSE